MFRNLLRYPPPQSGGRKKATSQAGSGNARGGEREVLLFRQTQVQIIRRPFKRSIGVTLQVNGCIRVSAPKGASLAQIEKFLEQHREWIDTHLGKYQELRDRYPKKRYDEGERFLFMGDAVPLRFAAVGSGGKRPRIVKTPDELRCEIGAAGAIPEPDQIATAVAAFYERSGRSVLSQRVQLYAERMQLFPRSVSFRSQNTRWGSCSSRGCLSLNWRLIVAPLAVIDYVVVHELAHLRHHNHSAAFWNLVATQVPDYASRRNWLRDHQYEADFLARRSMLHPHP